MPHRTPTLEIDAEYVGLLRQYTSQLGPEQQPSLEVDVSPLLMV